MVRTITVECTQCRQVCELYLSTDARIIIFNCPSCWTPIMYFRSKIFVLTENQINEIKSSPHDSSIMKILQKIVGARSGAHARQRRRGRPADRVPQPCLAKQLGTRRLDEVITQDDVTNLRIELETCKDSKQFIDKLLGGI